MEMTELQSLAEQFYENGLTDFWDSVNQWAYDNINNDSERELVYDFVGEMLEKNSSDIFNL